MFTSSDAIEAISKERGDALVVGTMTPNRYWEAVSEHRELDLPIFGGMGKASSVALGLALAQPDKKVIVLDGDGGLLMNLGTLVTIAGMEPKNLVHIVFEDGVYFTTGAQPVPGAGKFNLAEIAQGSGFPESHRFENLEDFASELPALLQKEGPVFINLVVTHGEDFPDFYMGSTADAMKRMKTTLGTD